MLVFLLVPVVSAGQTRGVDDYRQALTQIAASLRSGDAAAARRAADGLRGAAFSSPAGTFHPDTSLLDRVRAARTPDEARRAAAAVERLLAALDGAAGATAPLSAPDAALLARLQRDRAAAMPAAGGDVPELAVEEPGFFRSVRERLDAAGERFGRWLGRLLRALLDWLTRRAPRSAAAGGGALDARLVSYLVGALAVIAAVLALALFLRRGRRARTEPAIAPTSFELAADADPLSRRGGEWEERAAELAAARRFREAVRARFHGVLVALFAGGWLHYRKGRTNWEYVAALSPALPWRGDFIRLTRSFEEEWYGRNESAEADYRRASEEAARVLEGLRRREAA
ncbi:MAG TPA: DUF4129 domain-containing protein [Thermoanaerobaculia bacterium]|nr:DUF4129 domain-containing protein [Thermoanaerobaculia bacterium]